MLPRLIARIERHTRSLLEGSAACGTGSCPRCGATGGFSLHGLRARVFLVVLGRWVRSLRSFVARYRCAACGVTFTNYPAFALPGKRYVVATVLDRAAGYLDAAGATYRSAVAAPGTGAPTFHAARAPEAIDERALAPSTLWRWMAGLAAMPVTAARARRLLREATARLGRGVRLVAPGKARTAARHALLLRAADLIATEAAFSAAFARASIFTELATRCHFG